MFYFYLIPDIAYGSKVAIKHLATSGGYLHSHSHSYPEGSKRKCTNLIDQGYIFPK